MPTNRKRITREKLTSSKLMPLVRSVLSSGYDFFDELEHLLPDKEAIELEIKRLYRNKGRFANQDRIEALERKVTRNLWFADMAPGADPRITFLRSEWKAHRAEVLVYHVARFPGERPWGFWAFDFPGERPFVADGRSGPLGVNTPEQKLKDLQFLIERGLLSREEEAAIRAQDTSLKEALEGSGAVEEKER